MSLELVYGYDRPAEIASLFSEYTDFLIRVMPAFGTSLEQQNYSAEYENPGAKYALPGGRLYIAMVDGEGAGCVALRRIDVERGELKRMYVRPAYRGQHIGRAMAERIIRDAGDIGYRYVMLDTEPCLESAVRLYESLGFRRCPRYNDSPFDTTIFMQYELAKASSLR